jgi:hypothetical protein
MGMVFAARSAQTDRNGNLTDIGKMEVEALANYIAEKIKGFPEGTKVGISHNTSTNSLSTATELFAVFKALNISIDTIAFPVMDIRDMTHAVNSDRHGTRPHILIGRGIEIVSVARHFGWSIPHAEYTPQHAHGFLFTPDEIIPF